jgi:hypothetical protein
MNETYVEDNKEMEILFNDFFLLLYIEKIIEDLDTLDPNSCPDFAKVFFYSY